MQKDLAFALSPASSGKGSRVLGHSLLKQEVRPLGSTPSLCGQETKRKPRKINQEGIHAKRPGLCPQPSFLGERVHGPGTRSFKAGSQTLRLHAQSMWSGDKKKTQEKKLSRDPCKQTWPLASAQFPREKAQQTMSSS